MDEEFVERRPGDLEAYRRLDAFARLRLAPDAAAMARIRTTLVDEVSRRASERAALALAQPVAMTRGASPGRRLPRMRPSRVGGALLAATLTLGLVAGGVSAARPGGPLYGPRLWIEEAMLPAAPVARADAQVVRLDERLAEVRSAMASGDPGATAAALEAYASILAELEAEAALDEAVADRVLDDVTRHLAVLESLIGRVPPQAADALQHALDRSDSAIDHLNGEAPGRGGQGGQGGQGQGPGAAGGSGGQGGPDKTPPASQPTQKPAKADSTPKPSPTPQATPTPKPTKTPAGTEATEKPDKTPPAAQPTTGPRRTPASGGGSRSGSDS